MLDFTHVLAGPVTARPLAEQGADVLHDSPPRRCEARVLQIDTGWGKRFALLDLEQTNKAERLATLVRGADVFVQS